MMTACKVGAALGRPPFRHVAVSQDDDASAPFNIPKLFSWRKKERDWGLKIIETNSL